MAGCGRLALWTSPEETPATQTSTSQAGDSTLNRVSLQRNLAGAGLVRSGEYGLYRASRAFRSGVAWRRWHAAHGRPPCKPRIWKPTCIGGLPMTTSCGPTARCAWWWFKNKQLTLHQGDLGTGNAPQLWPLGERRTGGARNTYSLTLCQRTLVEQAHKREVRYSLAMGGLMPRPRGLQFGAPSASIPRSGCKNALKNSLHRGWANDPPYPRAVPAA